MGKALRVNVQGREPTNGKSTSVMQSDGNSWKMDTSREAITSELMI